MEAHRTTYSYNEYPPTEILGDNHYIVSNKSLSFQYRNKESDELLAFVSLLENEPPIQVLKEGHRGCEILMLDVRKLVSRDKWQVKDYALFNAILDEAEFRIENWCDGQNNNEFEFDYYWFDVTNENLQEVFERIDGAKRVGNIVYKTIERKPLTIQ